MSCFCMSPATFPASSIWSTPKHVIGDSCEICGRSSLNWTVLNPAKPLPTQPHRGDLKWEVKASKALDHNHAEETSSGKIRPAMTSAEGWGSRRPLQKRQQKTSFEEAAEDLCRSSEWAGALVVWKPGLFAVLDLCMDCHSLAFSNMGIDGQVVFFSFVDFGIPHPLFKAWSCVISHRKFSVDAYGSFLSSENPGLCAAAAGRSLSITNSHPPEDMQIQLWMIHSVCMKWSSSPALLSPVFHFSHLHPIV